MTPPSQVCCNGGSTSQRGLTKQNYSSPISIRNVKATVIETAVSTPKLEIKLPRHSKKP